MKKENRGIRVAVAMSGGVDSSVAALLLKKQGYDVQGFFMRNWSPLSDIPNDCPWQKDYEDVRKVCQHLDIPYATFNFENEYRERVLNYFLQEYQAGQTPNPDVLCNKEIKFGSFLKKAKSLGFDYIATGHYAKTRINADKNSADKRGEISLIRPKDRDKDQTYFLCRLKTEQLEHVLFPLGDLTKAEVRVIAKKANLPNAAKKDSQGICFIGKLPVREFLKRNLDLEQGTVVSRDGKVLGVHEGAQIYTIGQRHIGIATGKNMYVAGKDIKTNTVVMDTEDTLYTKNLDFADANWFKNIPNEFECDVQVRYRTKAIPGKVSFTNSRAAPRREPGSSTGELVNGRIELAEQARAVTPGQYAAFYDGDQLVGGAIIQ